MDIQYQRIILIKWRKKLNVNKLCIASSYCGFCVSGWTVRIETFEEFITLVLAGSFRFQEPTNAKPETVTFNCKNMPINLSDFHPIRVQPTKIWVGISIDFIQPTKPLIQRIFKRNNYHNEIDFDISVLAIDQNRKMPDDKCFVFYNQPSSIGINRDTFEESSISPEFDEIISVDFSKIQTEISHLKFIISNHRDELFENCEISFFIYDQPFWTLPSVKELMNFKIKPTEQFNLMELFEIHITENHLNWKLEVLQNSILLSKQKN